MSRNYYINGQCLVTYDGQELGLTDGNGKVTIKPNPRYLDIDVDGWYPGTSPERQIFPHDATISMTLVHFDIAVFSQAMKNSTLGAVEGTMATGGTLVGANNGYRTLSLSSPGPAARPWLFLNVYLREGYSIPLGAERSLLNCVFHAVPYTVDPYNSGSGSEGVVLYDT